MKTGYDFTIRTKRDLVDAVDEFGILPLFANAIPGFSVEEHVAPSAWFSADEGVWEWKGPVIRETGCAYGKFFAKKAAFVSAAVFPDLANFRRDGYDFDARFDDGLASFADQYLYDLIAEKQPVLTGKIREAGGYGKDGRKGFDTSLNRLMAQCYVVIDDFVYARDKQGTPYGWGIAEYSTPERWMGEKFRTSVYTKTPEESKRRLITLMKSLLPGVEEKAICRFLK